jgi:hypothetical protein
MTAVKLAIRNILTDDATYLTLLGNPSAEPYKTYYLYPKNIPDFPYVTFALRPSDVDTDRDKTVIVKNTNLVFYVFAVDALYETIASRIIYLMHHTGSDTGFRTILESEREDAYKPELNAYSIELIFSLHYRKEII